MWVGHFDIFARSKTLWSCFSIRNFGITRNLKNIQAHNFFEKSKTDKNRKQIKTNKKRQNTKTKSVASKQAIELLSNTEL